MDQKYSQQHPTIFCEVVILTTVSCLLRPQGVAMYFGPKQASWAKLLACLFPAAAADARAHGSPPEAGSEAGACTQSNLET
jgi:hypothetical protein